jgi:hypothetical protein
MLCVCVCVCVRVRAGMRVCACLHSFKMCDKLTVSIEIGMTFSSLKKSAFTISNTTGPSSF